MDSVATTLIAVIAFMTVFLFWLWFCFGKCVENRQKTRTSQQRRVYVGSRARQLSDQEPSVYVSPANLPPPPKYEFMAPPSYEEVMGVHYPGYAAQQPITQPLTHALAQSPSTHRCPESNVTVTDNYAPLTVNTTITVNNENERPSEVRS